MTAILRLDNVRYSYNGRSVLDVPRLEIARGSINGLAGPNGSGKTTLLKLLAFAEKCTRGSITYLLPDGKPVAAGVRQRISLLPQEPYLLRRSVFANIAYGLRIRGISENLPEKVHRALGIVGMNSSFADRHWDELSGGEAQRVALAARLILQPDCLLLDEPTASVDMESARNIRRAALRAKEEWGTTLVIASHNQAWLNDICDRTIYLYNGRVLEFTYENVVPGPWKKSGENLFCSHIADGQAFYAANAPGEEGAAVIAPESLEISKRDPSGSEKILHGIVTGIYCHKLETGPRIQVLCGDHRFTVAADDDVFTVPGLRPGRKVTLLYRPEQVRWLPK